MPIRKEDDGLSRARQQEKKYFRRKDRTASSTDFNRFIFMASGTKDQCYDWRLDFKKHQIPMAKFKIDQQKFINRPDAISSAVYGNAKYWWIIAMANDVKDPFIEFNLGKELSIPELKTVKGLLGL